MLKLSDNITKLPGIGPAFKQILSKINIFSIGDLFFHLPKRYLDFSKLLPIAQAQTGVTATFEGKITDIQSRKSYRSKLKFTEAILTDKTGNLKLIWFNQPYIANSIKVGQLITVAGTVEFYREPQLVNPLFELKNKAGTKTNRLLPVYPLTAKLTNLRLIKLIAQAFKLTKIVDHLPEQLLAKFNLPTLQQTLTAVHYPQNFSELSASQLRLAVDDALPQQLAVLQKQKLSQAQQAPKIKTNIELTQQFVKNLPFNLTDSQKRSAWDILQNLDQPQPMNCLLQGDVSSGKTVVAAMAVLNTALNNFQVALLAPTEILASQHYQTFTQYFKSHEIEIGLLTRTFSQTNKTTDITKAELIDKIKSKQINIVIGTHALLQESVNIPNLALVIIDEQHRFGVAQRNHLIRNSQNLYPHLLTMSATPIPRTLALSLYGDLEVSQLTQVPSSRKPIITKLASESDRQKTYQAIRNEVAAGHQAFIITPKVESTDDQVKSVKQEYLRLQKEVFPNLKIGLIYGKMKGADKERTMQDFSRGRFDILVATTVIEIGIDIPNATVILIEGAENFGLAQLHQLRGRVGRSHRQSYCYVFTSKDDVHESERLQIFAQTNDGFTLAEYDLQNRGFGDLFGKMQSGFNFRFPQFVSIKALKLARQFAQELLNQDPSLKNYPKLKMESEQYLQTIHLE